MSADVAIVGAGFAGACAAHALSRHARRIVLIDRLAEYPDLFRAEKIEPDQAALMRELGLLDFRSPVSEPVGSILDYGPGRARELDTVEQYGIRYPDTINALRRGLPGNVDLLLARVRRVVADAREPLIVMEDGTTVSARLVILATGGCDPLVSSLGVRARQYPELRSLTFGFDVCRKSVRTSELRGVNYHLPRNPHHLDYLTVFPIGADLRVNVFTQLDPTDPLVALAKADTSTFLCRFFPGLREILGNVVVSSRVQIVPTTCHRLMDAARPGVVFLGEAYQSVSPATGTGLSKVLTDVKVLCTRHAPRWLARGSVERADTRAFYRDPEKAAVDRKALNWWIHYQHRQLERVPTALRLRQRLTQWRTSG